MNATATNEAKTQDVSTLELAGLCRGRAATFELLARVFRLEVDDELLEALSTMSFPANSGNAEADRGARMIVDYLSNAWENTISELAVDFTRTFLGHGNNAYSAAYPFESVYTSSKRLRMQDAYVEVLAAYRAAGTAKQSDFHEEEDHVALEMEFCRILLNRAADAFEAGDEEEAWKNLDTEADFFCRHLGRWTPYFLNDVEKFSKTDFYAGFAAYTRGFFQIERALIDDMSLAPEVEPLDEPKDPEPLDVSDDADPDAVLAEGK